MLLSEARRQELIGVMWGEMSPIDTETLTEYQVTGMVLAVNFPRRQILIDDGHGDIASETILFKEDQAQQIRQRLDLSSPVGATVWQHVTGPDDNQIWLRGFTQEDPSVTGA